MEKFQELMAARPVVGRRVKNIDGQESVWLLPVEQLQVGDVLRVLPGERIPVDGVVLEGEVLISPRTVALPKKQAGEYVRCASMNVQSVIEIRVTADWQHSGYEQKLQQARAEAQQQPWYSRLWERFSSGYVPEESF